MEKLLKDKRIVDGQPGARARSRLNLWTLLPLEFLALAVILWAISLQNVNLRAMTDIGLLSVLPVTFYAALAVLTASFCLTVYFFPRQTPVLLLYLVALIFMFHGTPTILYGTLRYSWAWKHVGIIDYIQRYETVNPNTSFLDAYHNWPGFFSMNAMLTEIAGLENAVDFAMWATVFFNLAFLGALYLVFRALSTDRRLVWMALWFFFVADWVGQDYFAPQTANYFMYLVIIGVLLTWFRSSKRPSRETLKRWLRFERPVAWLDRLFAGSSDSEASAPSVPAQRVILMATIIVLMAVVTFSHQLTPWMVAGGLLLLALFGRTYARSLPVLMLVMMFTWLWFGASTFMGESITDILESVGTIENNVSENLIDLAQASSGQVLISLLGRGLTVLVLALGGLGALVRLIKGKLDLSAILLVVAPFLMLFGNSYGGEILFRIYFFSLPFLAFFIAAVFYPTPQIRLTWLRPAAAILVSGAMIVAFLFAYLGKEKQYYFSPNEVAAAEYLFNSAPPGSLIIEGTRNYPTLFRNYEAFTFVPIGREPVESRMKMIADPVNVLERWMSNDQYPAIYLLITRSMKAEIDMVGDMPAGSLDEIERKLLESGQFEALYSNQDAAIYVLKDR